MSANAPISRTASKGVSRRVKVAALNRVLSKCERASSTASATSLIAS